MRETVFGELCDWKICTIKQGNLGWQVIRTKLALRLLVVDFKTPTVL